MQCLQKINRNKYNSKYQIQANRYIFKTVKKKQQIYLQIIVKISYNKIKNSIKTWKNFM